MPFLHLSFPSIHHFSQSTTQCKQASSPQMFSKCHFICPQLCAVQKLWRRQTQSLKFLISRLITEFVCAINLTIYFPLFLLPEYMSYTAKAFQSVSMCSAACLVEVLHVSALLRLLDCLTVLPCRS